ncbi:hypothetical protein MY11210_001192 [Beauveria gryllotalpidicola]
MKCRSSSPPTESSYDDDFAHISGHPCKPARHHNVAPPNIFAPRNIADATGRLTYNRDSTLSSLVFCSQVPTYHDDGHFSRRSPLHMITGARSPPATTYPTLQRLFLAQHVVSKMASQAPEAHDGDAENTTQGRSKLELPAGKSTSGAKPGADDDSAGGARTTAYPAEDEDAADHEATTTNDDLEDGELESTVPPLPDEPTPGGPPLPSEPVPEDDGWDCQFDARTQAWFFYNRFTGKTQWENPRMPASVPPGTTVAPQPPTHEKPAAGGYNPAIHGDYDPNAWYAQGAQEAEDGIDAQANGISAAAAAAAELYAATATFNRYSGGFQAEDMGPGRHSDDAKAHRQMNAYFDADAASKAHDGRSLKAERQNQKPSKAEVKAFKEKRRARKEEKRRAWLRD